MPLIDQKCAFRFQGRESERNGKALLRFRFQHNWLIYLQILMALGASAQFRESEVIETINFA